MNGIQIVLTASLVVLALSLAYAYLSEAESYSSTGVQTQGKKPKGKM
ncbi:MAG: hypothetical protein JHC23_06780 [Sulfolobus sp.]|nr:hypothetical protein [Sulfolobus sp.]